MTFSYYEPAAGRWGWVLGVGVALLVAAACTNKVEDQSTGTTSDGGGIASGGGGATGGSGGSATGGSGGSVTTSNGTGGSSTVSEAIAITRAQLDEVISSSSGSSSTSSTSSSGDIDPDTLYIMLSNLPIACDDPYDSACGQWDVTIRIPPSLQHPGLIQLSDPEVVTSASYMSEDCNGSSSSSGGPGSGTLEIHIIDDTQLVGTLQGTSFYIAADVNGDFTAAVCP